MRCDSLVAQTTINHRSSYCLGEVIQGRVNSLPWAGGMPEQQRTGRSCKQNGFRLPEICTAAPALHPSFVWAGVRAVGKAGFGDKDLMVQGTGAIWLPSKACNPEQLFFFVSAWVWDFFKSAPNIPSSFTIHCNPISSSSLWPARLLQALCQTHTWRWSVMLGCCLPPHFTLCDPCLLKHKQAATTCQHALATSLLVLVPAVIAIEKHSLRSTSSPSQGPWRWPFID